MQKKGNFYPNCINGLSGNITECRPGRSPRVQVSRDHDIHQGIGHGQKAPNHTKLGGNVTEYWQLAYRAQMQPAKQEFVCS
jgi:hypothetical protein